MNATCGVMVIFVESMRGSKLVLTFAMITVLLGAVAVRDARAVTADQQFELEILAPGATPTPTPTPAVTPTPTPTPGGGAACPPTPISPQQHPDPFVANEDTVAPYVYVGMLDGTVISPGEVGTTYAFNPLVTGKTNLRDAVIFIEVSDFPGVFYTTHANVGGVWEFTVPQPLAYGFHHPQITAVSPIDPTLRPPPP